MSYNWINGPVLNAIEYFTGSFISFSYYARQFGSLFFLIGIVWNSVQLIFSTTQIRKVIVSNITRFIFFILILNMYFPVVMGIRKIATTIGSSAGISADVLSVELSNFMKKIKSLVDEDIKADTSKLNDAIAFRDALPKGQELIDKYKKQGIFMKEREAAVLQKAVEDYNAADSRVKFLQSIIDEMYKNPKGNMKTLLALQSLLKPVDTKNVDYSKAYALDLTLYNSKNENTGFLSPSSIMRISMLIVNVMWEKEWISINPELENTDSGKLGTKIKKAATVASFSLNNLFTFILTFITVLGIILATIFFLLQYVMCILEYSIVTSMAIVLLPFMLIDGLKSYAEKIMSAIFGLSIKLCVITLCMYFAAYSLLSLCQDVIIGTEGMTFTVFAYCFFSILLCWVLTQNGPQIAVTMLTGNPQLSMGELVHAMGTVAGAGHLIGKTAGMSGSAIKTGGQFAMNRIGDAAAVAGAGKGAFNAAIAGGSSAGGALLAGVGSGISTLANRDNAHTKRHIADAVLGKGWNQGSGSGSAATTNSSKANTMPSIDFAGAARESKDANPVHYAQGQYASAYAKYSNGTVSSAPKPLSAQYNGPPQELSPQFLNNHFKEKDKNDSLT